MGDMGDVFNAMRQESKAFNARRGDDLTLLVETWAKDHGAELRHCSPWHLKLILSDGRIYDIWPTKDKYMHKGSVQMLIRPLLRRLDMAHGSENNTVEYKNERSVTPFPLENYSDVH